LLLRRGGRCRRRDHVSDHVIHHLWFSCLSCCNCYVDSTSSQVSRNLLSRRLNFQRDFTLPLDKSLATCCLHCSHVSLFCKISPLIPTLRIIVVAISHRPKNGCATKRFACSRQARLGCEQFVDAFAPPHDMHVRAVDDDLRCARPRV